MAVQKWYVPAVLGLLDGARHRHLGRFSPVMQFLATLLPFVVLANVFQSAETLSLAVLLSLISATVLCWLYIAPRSWSAEPSSPVLLYLLASCLCDLIWILFRGRISPTDCLSTCFLWLFWTQILIKAALFTAECQDKGTELFEHLSPEGIVRVIREVSFLWFSEIMARGVNGVLQIKDLPSIGQEMSSARLKVSILRAWDRRGQYCDIRLWLSTLWYFLLIYGTDKPENKSTLPLVLYQCLSSPLWAATAPRAFLVLFRSSQPILIRRTIRFVSQLNEKEDDTAEAFWIMVFATLVYIGLAVG